MVDFTQNIPETDEELGRGGVVSLQPAAEITFGGEEGGLRQHGRSPAKAGAQAGSARSLRTALAHHFVHSP